MNTSVFSDPVKVGPGIWFTLHTNAVKATTDPLKLAFDAYVSALCDSFKCKKCQQHFRKFIDTHPLVNYWDIRDISGRDIGFFQWTWELHNEVNKFLGKYQPSLQEAYDFFSDSEAGACFNCGASSPPSHYTSDQPSPFTDFVTPIDLPPRDHPFEQRSRAIPPILTLYRTSDTVKPEPFHLIPRPS